MKVKPLFAYSEGSLADAEGGVVAVVPAQARIEEFSESNLQAGIEALAKEGANFILLRFSLENIAPAPGAFNEAALARLREALKKAEEMRVALVLSIEGDEPSASELFIDAAEHTARRLKDCASLLGFALPLWADDGFLLELAARLEKKHPTLRIFIPPGAKISESARRDPFVPQSLWPEGWG